MVLHQYAVLESSQKGTLGIAFRVPAILLAFHHTLHPVRLAYRAHNIHNHIDSVIRSVLVFDPALFVYPLADSYSFVIGANFASNRLIPTGAGKATSNSILSPSP